MSFPFGFEIQIRELIALVPIIAYLLTLPRKSEQGVTIYVVVCCFVVLRPR